MQFFDRWEMILITTNVHVAATQKRLIKKMHLYTLVIEEYTYKMYVHERGTIN
jgi:hypothetical protein